MYSYVWYETDRVDYVYDLVESEKKYGYAGNARASYRVVEGDGWCGVRFIAERRPWSSRLTAPEWGLVSGVSCVRWEPFVYLYVRNGGSTGGMLLDTEVLAGDEWMLDEVDSIVELIEEANKFLLP